MNSASAETDCPACGRMTDQRWLYSINHCEVVRCSSCGIGRAIAPAFDPRSYYTSDYFSGQRADGYADYLGAETVLRKEFAQTVRFIRGWCAGGRLLEIGCAYGYFLREAQPYFDVFGIELAADAASHCRSSGFQVFAGAAEEATLRQIGMLDVVVMLDVIEHLPDPRSVLHLLASQLKPGGIIVITTGDFSSPTARLLGRRWRLMTPPQHLWFFGRESMRRMAEAVGMTIEAVDRPWKIVPLSLIVFQLRRMLGLSVRAPSAGAGIGLPVNLFDTMRVVMRKPPS